jgi:hypothetical protein
LQPDGCRRGWLNRWGKKNVIRLEDLEDARWNRFLQVVSEDDTSTHVLQVTDREHGQRVVRPSSCDCCLVSDRGVVEQVVLLLAHR